MSQHPRPLGQPNEGKTRTKRLRHREPSKLDIANQDGPLRDRAVTVEDARGLARGRELRGVGFGSVKPEVRGAGVELDLRSEVSVGLCYWHGVNGRCDDSLLRKSETRCRLSRCRKRTRCAQNRQVSHSE
jgi:hypothetical protein